MVRILLVALVSVVALIAVVWVVGMLLPVAHVASVSASYPASAKEVFALISDYRGHPDWRPSVDRIKELETRDGKAAWEEIGGSGPLPMELTESDPPRRMVTTILSQDMPFGGRWIYEIEPASSGVVLTITEEGEVYNPIFRFVSRFIMGHQRTATKYLQDLGNRLGEDVSVEVLR